MDHRETQQNREPGTDPRVLRSKAKIIEAATRLLRDGGPDAVTVDAVARVSGVSKMTFYRHWKGRDTLLVDTFRASVLDPASSETLRSGSPADRLEAAIIGYGRQFADRATAHLIASLVVAAANNPALDEIRQGIAGARGDHLGKLLEECIQAGILSPDLDRDLAISQLIGPLAFRFLLSFEPIDDELCRALVNDLIAAHPGPAAAPTSTGHHPDARPDQARIQAMVALEEPTTSMTIPADPRLPPEPARQDVRRRTTGTTETQASPEPNGTDGITIHGLTK